MNELVEGVEELSGTVTGLAGFDAAWAGDESLATCLVEIERARRKVDAAALHLLAEIDARDLTDETHGLVTSTWLSRQARLPRPKCTRLVRFARSLSRFDRLDAALSNGEIGIDHLRVVVDLTTDRIIDAMVELQDLFVGLVAGRTFQRWETEVHNIVALLDQDGSYDPESDVTANRLTLSGPGSDTARLVRGQLVGSNGETVREVLNTIADELYRQHRRDHDLTDDLPVPSRPVLLALALVEACRRAVARPVDQTATPATDVTIVVPAVPAPDPIDIDDPAGLLPRWFTTNSPTSTEPFAHLHGETLDGVPIADGTLRLLCCDPVLHAVVVDGLTDQPLDVGTATRVPTRRLRRGARTRDGGCVFPGCGAPWSWTDLHHVTRFPDGPTNLSNLASLCRHHHHVSHRRRWTMGATDDGWFWWRTPNGTTLWSQRHQRIRAGPTPDTT